MTTDVQTEDEIEEQLLESSCNQLLALLDDRSADVLRRRFGLDYQEPQTLEQIGAIYGLTRERIRQIQKAAIDKLVRSVTDLEDAADRAAGRVLVNME